MSTALVAKKFEKCRNETVQL